MTLTEILMALMVMGIGVVSVITLFPISLLRSVEATKLTNATLLKQNSVARIEASFSVNPTGVVNNSAILIDPDRDGNTNEHEDTNYIFDPLGAWTMVDFKATYAGYVDPLRLSTGTTDTTLARYHANIIGNNPLGLAGVPAIRRYTFGLAEGATTYQAAREAAAKFVTLPDSHITIFDGLAGTVAGSTEPGMFNPLAGGDPEITFNHDEMAEFVGQDVRITAINSANFSSAILGGNVMDANTVTIAGGATIPGKLGSIDHVIIDIQERRYTWLATISNVGSQPTVSVATFFRRSFAPEDEKVYSVTEPAGSYNTFVMDWGVNGISTNALGEYVGAPPGFEKGGWLFDLNGFRWWKITAVQERDTDSDGTPDGFRFATDPEMFDNNTGGRQFRAIFPRNVIEVYTLKK